MEQAIPQRMLRWNLYGAGLESLGRNGRPEEVDVPAFGPDELLVRQDACGLCFSDTKVIALGGNHPRLTGRDMAADPVTLGHEVACTVVDVGANLGDRYHAGERFVIQADVYYQGRNLSYGYAIAGGLAEYSVIPRAILEGDEGCYLLPIQPETGYVEAALTEPWACVVSAYAQAHRNGLLHQGRMLIVGSEEADSIDYDWRSLFTPGRVPGGLDLFQVHGTALQGIIAGPGRYESSESALNERDWQARLAAPFSEESGYDDIVILGSVSPETIEAAATQLRKHGILNIVSHTPPIRDLALDIGRIHYNWHHYIGTDTHRPGEAYAEGRTADLVPHGLTWFLGAGGPMGQMHVQRAVMHEKPPRRIVCTDVDTARLQSVTDRFGDAARERGIELISLNPNETDAEAFHDALWRSGNGRGFDDILSMVPSAAVTEHAAGYLADGGWLNIFAGVARGTLARLNLDAVVRRRVRYLGSTGSSLADMRETLERVERGALATNASLAAIGGMMAAKEGLQAVQEGWFPGKTLIFPLIHDLPLTPLSKLKAILPTVYDRLKEGRFWTREAEAELFRLKSGHTRFPA